jgi:hypothetical protein
MEKTKWEKARIIVFWITTGIIALETGAGAEWDLVRNPFVRSIFAHLGYPEYLLTILGAWKVLAFVALLVPRFPRLKEWTYAGLFFVYTGAAASHLTVGDGPSAWAGPAVFGGIVLISYALRPDSRKLASGVKTETV